MKRFTVFIISLLIFSIDQLGTTLYAQALNGTGPWKGKHITYELMQRNDDLNLIVVSNTKNILVKTPQLQPMDYGRVPDPNTLLVHKPKLFSLVSNLFSSYRLQELARNEERFRVWLYFNISGKLEEIRYSLSSHTLLTAYELEKIENCIKKNIRGRFITNEWKHGNYVMLNYNIYYKELIEFKK